MGFQGIGLFWTIYLIKPCFSSGKDSQLTSDTEKTGSRLLLRLDSTKQALTYQGLIFPSLKAADSVAWREIPQF
jgi:hypothetical protein